MNEQTTNNNQRRRIPKICSLKICGRVIKFLVAVFLLGAIFYGFVWIPSQQLNLSNQQLRLSQQMAQINLNKINNSCQLVAQNTVRAVVAQTQKNDPKKQVEEAVQKQIFDNAYQSCMFGEGLANAPVAQQGQNRQAPQGQSAPAGQQAPSGQQQKAPEKKN